MPPPTGSPVAFAAGDTVRVLVNGLAVRVAPFTDAGLVEALVHDPVTGDRLASAASVRLDAGHITWVELGPLVLDGVPWYRVHTGMQPGESDTDLVTWDADGDGQGSDAGWIAGAGSDGTYLELVAPDPSAPAAPEPLVAASGVWDYDSEPFSARSQVGGAFAAAEHADAGCEFSVTLSSGEVLVAASLDAGFAQHEFDSSGTGLPSGTYTVAVRAGVPGQTDAECPWTMTLYQNAG